MAKARMYGRLGWHGQCSCCCAPRSKRSERALEERTWRNEDWGDLARDVIDQRPPVGGLPKHEPWGHR